ncbi:hypothetical protein D3C81_315080 [compost metagenome]|uniref:hypothetical protein n=1 Tax=Stenotrophomonas sp. PA-6-5C TaxID=2665487 RepID=UPI000F9A80E7|nr:hypothetical protein [Stenotrophomonas sp. PA-6-5C]
MADTQRERVMHREIGMDLAERVVLDLLESGWSRQSLRKHEAAGPTPCGTAFYLVRDGGIAVAYFPIAEFTDANGRGLFFPIRDFFPPVQKSAHGEVDSLEPFEVGDQVLSMDRDLEGSWNYEDEVRAVRPHPGHHTQFGGRDYYQVKIKDRVGGSGGCHDLVPIAGRPWQMRGEGECLIRIRPAPLAVAATRPALPGPTGPVCMTAQLFPYEPRRMKQPAKDVLREQLAVAADRIIEQAEEIQRLRDAANQATEQLRAALATN